MLHTPVCFLLPLCCASLVYHQAQPSQIGWGHPVLKETTVFGPNTRVAPWELKTLDKEASMDVEANCTVQGTRSVDLCIKTVLLHGAAHHKGRPFNNCWELVSMFGLGRVQGIYDRLQVGQRIMRQKEEKMQGLVSQSQRNLMWAPELIEDLAEAIMYNDTMRPRQLLDIQHFCEDGDPIPSSLSISSRASSRTNLRSFEAGVAQVGGYPAMMHKD